MGGECRGRRRLGHFDTKINRVAGTLQKNTRFLRVQAPRWSLKYRAPAQTHTHELKYICEVR